MGIISRPRSNPAMLRALARYCSYREIEEISEQDLQRVIAPDALGGGGAGSAWRDTLLLAQEFDLLDLRDGVVVIAAEMKGELADDDIQRFRTALRRLVLGPAHNDRLWDLTGGRWSSVGSREFSRAAAWFLDQPLERSEGTLSDRARRQVPGDQKVIENEEQARVFIRWATSLGLAATLFGEPIPDPSVSVRDELPGAFGGEGDLPALALRDRLVAALPVLYTGPYAAGLDKVLAPSPRRLPAAAGAGLLVALRRLERQGTLKFRERSDAPALVLEEPDTANPTHIGLVGA